MKKNLISVVILALILANLILTAILTISVMPQTKKANELITKVVAAIDLDLEGAQGENADTEIPIDDIDNYNIAEEMTIPLKKGDDGENHYVMLSVSLVMNKKAEGYKKFGTPEALATKEALIKDKINAVVSKHTIEEMRNNTEEIQAEIVSGIQGIYGSDFIYQVAFSKSTYQ